MTRADCVAQVHVCFSSCGGVRTRFICVACIGVQSFYVPNVKRRDSCLRYPGRLLSFLAFLCVFLLCLCALRCVCRVLVATTRTPKFIRFLGRYFVRLLKGPGAGETSFLRRVLGQATLARRAFAPFCFGINAMTYAEWCQVCFLPLPYLRLRPLTCALVFSFVLWNTSSLYYERQ